MKKDSTFQVYDLRTDNDKRIEAEAIIGVSLGPTDALVDELISIGKEGEYESFVEGGKFKKYCNGHLIVHERVREIGQTLWDAGRHDLMAAVFYRVIAIVGVEKTGALERAWTGIGDWVP